MILYKTLAKEAHCEYEVERSRFLGHAKPVDSREEAESYIAAIKKQYKDATHNVPAMVLGDKSQIQWASDDGEPQGTSGAPMVHLMVEEGLTNLVVVVTRYFGGIKLGTGGLVRAYTNTAKLAIEAAGIREVAERFRMSAGVDYKTWDRLEKLLNDAGYTIEEKDYGADVTFTVCCLSEQKGELKRLTEEVSKGQMTVLEENLYSG